MPKKGKRQQHKEISPKEGGNQNGSPEGTFVPDGGALAENFPQDDAEVNFQSALAGDVNLSHDSNAENSQPVSAVVGGSPTELVRDDWEEDLSGDENTGPAIPPFERLLLTAIGYEEPRTDTSPASSVNVEVAPILDSSVNAAVVPIQANEVNFFGGYQKPEQEPSCNFDMASVRKLLESMKTLKPFFVRQTSDDHSLRKTFKGCQISKTTETRYSSIVSPSSLAVCFLVEEVGMFLKSKPVEKGKPRAKGGEAFLKEHLKQEHQAAEASASAAEDEEPVCGNDSPCSSLPIFFGEDRVSQLFGGTPVEISFFFDHRDYQKRKKSSVPNVKLLSSRCDDFLKIRSFPNFETLFTQSGGKTTERHSENIEVFKVLFNQYFSAIEGEDAHLLAKMKLFLKIMSKQNQKCLFESFRTNQFLYDLAIDLLIKLGRDTKRVSFDDDSSSRTAIIILIFKYLHRQYDDMPENDDGFKQFKTMFIQLYRTITECFSANNKFVIEDMCFDDKTDIHLFNVIMSAESSGLEHNSLLDCDLSRFMLNPRKVWELIHGKKGLFAWISPPGSGKSTLLGLLGILQAIMSKANVLYVGPDTATMNPEYIAMLIEVVCQFMESCGLERPVIRLKQFGVAKCEAGVVNVFMTRDVYQCLPLISSVFNDTPSIVIVDDNKQLTPKQIQILFSKFEKVSQLHVCGSTMDLDGCKEVVRIGEDIASSVSFCVPTFICKLEFMPMSPEAYRKFLIAMQPLRRETLNFFRKYDEVSMGGFISFFQGNCESLVRFYDIVSSFTKVKLIRFVDLVKLARLLKSGFPAYQVGKVYSVKELNEITVLVRNAIEILNRIGYVFEDQCLQFPKDLSEDERQKECKTVINAARDGDYAQIMLTSANHAYNVEKMLVSLSEVANTPIMSSSKGLSTTPSHDKDPTGGGGEESDSSSDGESQSQETSDVSKKKKKITRTEKKQKQKKKPTKPVHEAKPHVSINSAIMEQRMHNAAAADAAAAASAASAAAAAADSVAAGTNRLSADDADSDSTSAHSSNTAQDDSHLTFEQILNIIFKATELVGHRSLPKRNHVIEALSILRTSEHPDSARWLKSFIYGVVLPDTIMPTEFIELCLEMFNQGRMIIVLAYELFHLQSWNSRCCLRTKIIVADPIPQWHLLQTMARAGRLGTEHSGEISSWVSCLVLDVSTKESISNGGGGEESDSSSDGENMCPIEAALIAMISRGNFSMKHLDFIRNFLGLFRFAYQDELCHHACVGGQHYFMDFMKFISGVLVSDFISKFECFLPHLDECMQALAFTKFRHEKVDDDKKTRKDFADAMIRLVGSDSASMSFCLMRATGAAKDFVGMSRFVLPRLFKELYKGYPNSMASFLELIRNLLMNLQTMPLCRCDRQMDNMVSAMLLVITTTLDFVGDILHLLADKLRERDMEQFRVGFKPELSPIQNLRNLLESKAGLPTLQEFRAFLEVNKSELPDLNLKFKNVCDFLSPPPSGPFHDMNQKCQALKDAIADKKKENKDLELFKIKPKTMKLPEWASHQKSDEYKALCKKADEDRLQLHSDKQKLEHELALIEKELGNLPTDLSAVVGYFKKRI